MSTVIPLPLSAAALFDRPPAPAPAMPEPVSLLPTKSATSSPTAPTAAASIFASQTPFQGLFAHSAAAGAAAPVPGAHSHSHTHTHNAGMASVTAVAGAPAGGGPSSPATSTLASASVDALDARMMSSLLPSLPGVSTSSFGPSSAAVKQMEAAKGPDAWLPTARSAFALAVDPDHQKAYVFGGAGIMGYNADLLEIDLATQKLTTLETSGRRPVACAYSSMVYYDGCIYHFGGIRDGFDYSADLHRYNTATRVWTKISGPPAPEYDDDGNELERPVDDSLPPARCAASFTVWGDCAVLYGGLGEKYRHLCDTWLLDLSTLTWIAVSSRVTPPATRGHCAAAIGDFVVVMGGKSASQGCLSATVVHAMNMHTLEWQPVQVHGKMMPSALVGASCTQFSYTAGGKESEEKAKIHNPVLVVGGSAGEPSPHGFAFILYAGVDDEGKADNALHARWSRMNVKWGEGIDSSCLCREWCGTCWDPVSRQLLLFGGETRDDEWFDDLLVLRPLARPEAAAAAGTPSAAAAGSPAAGSESMLLDEFEGGVEIGYFQDKGKRARPAGAL